MPINSYSFSCQKAMGTHCQKPSNMVLIYLMSLLSKCAGLESEYQCMISFDQRSNCALHKAQNVLDDNIESLQRLSQHEFLGHLHNIFYISIEKGSGLKSVQNNRYWHQKKTQMTLNPFLANMQEALYLLYLITCTVFRVFRCKLLHITDNSKLLCPYINTCELMIARTEYIPKKMKNCPKISWGGINEQ